MRHRKALASSGVAAPIRQAPALPAGNSARGAPDARLPAVQSEFHRRRYARIRHRRSACPAHRMPMQACRSPVRRKKEAASPPASRAPTRPAAPSRRFPKPLFCARFRSTMHAAGRGGRKGSALPVGCYSMLAASRSPPATSCHRLYTSQALTSKTNVHPSI